MDMLLLILRTTLGTLLWLNSVSITNISELRDGRVEGGQNKEGATAYDFKRNTQN